MPRKTKEWIGKTDDSQPLRTTLYRVFKRDGGACQECGIEIGPKRWEADHRIRLKDGGENRESNLQVLCVTCHRDKTNLENTLQARANRIKYKTHSIKKPNHRRGFWGWRKFDGTLVWKGYKEDN